MTAMRARGILLTTMSSEELSKIGADILERCMFSARTFYASHTQTIQDEVNKLVAGEIDVATVRQTLQDSLDSLGYRPATPEAVGTITDLRSDQRLNLIIKTNTEMAQGYGDWQQSQDSLDAYPAQELIRAESRDKQREWYDRWTAAGGQVFDGQPEGQAIEDGVSGRMIALINDPIWEAISAFGLPYPPFDFNSGLDVRPVDRQEAQDLGLISPDETPAPDDRGFNDGLAVADPVSDGSLREVLLSDLGPGYEFADGVLRKTE